MVVLFVVLTFVVMLLADWIIKRKEYRKLMTPDMLDHSNMDELKNVGITMADGGKPTNKKR